MADAKNCPKCGLVNPPNAHRCDCGWDFVSNSAQQSYDPKAANDSHQRKRIAYSAGVLGFSIMSIQGLVSTLNPSPDGRVLNTAPAIGVDLFLFVGVLGIMYCAFQLIRGR